MSDSIHRKLARVGVKRIDQLLALVTRWAPGSARDRFILVSGFHHSGTTLVQALLRRQGVFTFVDDAEDAYPDRPRELPLRHIHRIERAARRADRTWAMTKQTTNTVDTVRRLGIELRLLAPDCTLVLCERDPAATALSLSKRHGWDPARARADAAAQQHVTAAWRKYAPRHRGPAFPLAGGLHAAAGALSAAHPAARGRTIAGPGRDGGRREPGRSHERAGRRAAGSVTPPGARHFQSHRPVYPVERDAWMATEDGEVLALLQDIRARFGTSPS